MKKLILMMFILKLLAEIICEPTLNFFQNDYHVKPEWFQVVSYDKKYVKDMDGIAFKRTRTLTALNLTLNFNIDLANHLECIIQVYRFASNEYREFPLRLQINFCKAIAENAGGLGQFTQCGNFTGCPFVKGRKYHICNWTPDESKFPPYMPTGKYMGEVQGLFNSTELFIWRGYASVTRPEV